MTRAAPTLTCSSRAPGPAERLAQHPECPSPDLGRVDGIEGDADPVPTAFGALDGWCWARGPRKNHLDRGRADVS
jgi:hypothetical protein